MNKVTSAFLALILGLAVSFSGISYANAGDKKPPFNPEQMMQDIHEENDDPAQTVFACAMSITQASAGLSGQSPMEVVEENEECIEKIKDLCQFEIKKGKIKYDLKGGVQLGACLIFPFEMWTRK